MVNNFICLSNRVYTVHGELLRCRTHIHNNSVYVLVPPMEAFAPAHYDKSFRYYMQKCYEVYYNKVKTWEEDMLRHQQLECCCNSCDKKCRCHCKKKKVIY